MRVEGKGWLTEDVMVERRRSVLPSQTSVSLSSTRTCEQVTYCRSTRTGREVGELEVRPGLHNYPEISVGLACGAICTANH